MENNIGWRCFTIHEIIEILHTLSQPYALLILHLIHSKERITLTGLLSEMKALSKYRTVRNTVERLVEAGLIKKEVKKRGAAESWHITLTEIGKKIARAIHESIKTIVKPE